MAATIAAPAPARPAVALPSLPPVLPICGAFLLGTTFGPTRPDLWPLMLGLAVCTAVCALFARAVGAWVAAFALLAFAVGLWRAIPPPPHAVVWPATPVNAVRGVATTWPVARGENVRVTVAIDGARTSGNNWAPARATLVAFLPSYPTIARGDTVIVVGTPALQSAGPNATDGELFGQSLSVARAEQPAQADIARRSLRDRLLAAITASVRAPEAGFAAGVLLGAKSAIDEPTRAALNATGTTQHYVVTQWKPAHLPYLAVDERIGLVQRS